MALSTSVQQDIKQLGLKPAPPSHLPPEIYLERFLVPELSGTYWEREGEIWALNLSGRELVEGDLTFLNGEGWASLRILNISDNRFTQLKIPDSLSELQYLDVRGNKQLQSLAFKQGLPRLKRLFLSQCGLKQLTLPAGFSQLTYLECYDNSALSKLRLEGGFPALTHLYLSNCKLEEINIQEELTQLRFLLANKNQLTDFITRPVLAFPSLETLDLQNNQIKEIPSTFNTLFPRLLNISLKNNPLPDTIQSNVGNQPSKDLEFIRRYIGELNVESAENNECKVLLLGNGCVGKTTFLTKLVEKRFEEIYTSTHGIVIKENYTGHDEVKSLVEPYIYNIWDFAGQDIYHATHRLFMQANALYLILWDKETENRRFSVMEEAGKPRTYENFQLDYWLHYAQLRGKGRSPAIIIQTKRGRDGVVDVSKLHNTYGTNFLMASHQIESEETDLHQSGYFSLLASMRSAVKKIKEKEQIPKLWDEVRLKVRRAKDAGEKWMTLDQFSTICEDYKEPLEILNWLTQSGVLFYQEEIFKGIILDQLWAIEAIYTLFNRDKVYYKLLIGEEGGFSGKYLAEQDLWGKYSEFERELFISFMLSCEMCFETTTIPEENVPFAKRTFIAPQLLPERKEAQANDFWEGRSALYMEYEHQFFHYGIIQSFIVRTHSFAQPLGESRAIWKMGTRLKEGDQWAQVEAWENLIQVQVTENGKPLLDKIRNELDSLRDEDGKAWVSVDGDYFVEVRELEALAEEEGNTHVITIKDRHAENPVKRSSEILSFIPFLDRDLHHKFIRTSEMSTKDQRKTAQVRAIKGLIGKGRLEAAIDALLEASPESLENRVFALQGRYSSYAEKVQKRILRDSEKDFQYHNMIEEALGLCDQMLASFINSPSNPTHRALKRESIHDLSSVKEEPRAPRQGKVYFSYAWGDDQEEGESREELVDKLYDALLKEPFELQRDKKSLEYGGLISQFMQELGKGDLIVVFVSDKYVRSEYCMYELYEIARNCQWEKQHFTQRILPVRVEKLTLDEPDTLEDYFDHWEKKQSKWERLIQKRLGQITSSQSDRYHKIKQVHNSWGDLADWLMDINAMTIPLLSQNDFEQVKTKIHERLNSKSKT